MTESGRKAAGVLNGQTLCDIAQLLETTESAEGRTRRALELLGRIVPYEQCALLEAEPGCEARLLALPAMKRGAENELTVALVKLFGKMLQERALPSPSAVTWAAHLAVPLIGLGELIGVLFVSRSDGFYEIAHLRILSVVASQVASYLMLLRARTEESARSRQLGELSRSANSAERAKDQIVDLVARELQSPFEAGRAWLRLLASRNLSRDARAHAVEAVERSIRTRARLFRDLFDLSSNRELRLELGTVEPAGLIETAIEDLRPLAEQRTIQLEGALDRSVQPVIADAGRLDEVLEILLANAFRFTPDGGRVSVCLDPADSGIRIQVVDSGKGFDPQEAPRVLERLDLQDAPAESGQRHLKFGLAMARHLVELHGGSLHAESSGQGQGATLTIGLPQVSSAPAA